MVGKHGNRGIKGGDGGGASILRKVVREDHESGSHSSAAEGKADGIPVFRTVTSPPPSEDFQACLKYYIQLEEQLRRLSKMRNESMQIMKKSWAHILSHIEYSLEASRILFTLDPSYYMKKEMDVRVWKYSIYQFITVLRREYPADSKPTFNQADSMLYVTIRTSIHHLKRLITAIPTVVKLDLEPVYNRNGFIRGSVRNGDPSSEGELAYRLFIALGDLFRYLFDMDKLNHNVKNAQDMYTFARFVDTEKSRAYNQLGLMAKSWGDAMGVIYNFTRAWHVANPTAGAREQLLYIFDDLYKMYNLNRGDYWFTMMKTADNDLSSQRKYLEFWVWDLEKNKKALPVEKKVPPLRRDHLASVSDTLIYARCNFIYGHFLGMLYTRIGTEALEHVCKEMLVYFEGMIMVKNFNVFKFTIEAVAMIAFHIGNLTSSPDTKEDAPKVAHTEHMKNVAFCGALGIATILVEKIMDIIQHLDWDNPLLTTCAAALHVFLFWLQRYQNICKVLQKRWRELLKLSQKNCSIPKNIVKDIRDIFLTSLFRLYAEFSIREVKHKSLLFPTLTKAPFMDCTEPLGMLPEHVLLDGFTVIVVPEDIKSMAHCYYSSRFTHERAQNYFRLKGMTFVCSKIYGSFTSERTAPLKLFEPLEHLYYNDEFKTISFIHDRMSGRQLLEKKVSTGRQPRPDCNNARIIIRKPLRSDKKKVKKVLRSEVLLSRNPLLSTVGFEIWSRLYTMGIKGELVVQPVRVVLDTNLLIRQLSWIKRLIYVLPHPIIIPTTVILELKGLLKGSRGRPPHTRNAHLSKSEEQERVIDSMELAEHCTRALEFLERYKKYFRVVTVYGKQIEMYNFVGQKIFDERFDPTVKNDEKILEVCCQLEAQDREARALDQPLRIYRNTILLTGDISLRVRAMVQDIPTREIHSFTRWLEETRGKSLVHSSSLKARRRYTKNVPKSDH